MQKINKPVEKTPRTPQGRAEPGHAGEGAASQPASSPLLRLQQAIGNRAVGRLIQAKLTVSQPGDPYEQEADRVADQVMRMPQPGVPDRAGLSRPRSFPGIRRMGTAGEGDICRQATGAQETDEDMLEEEPTEEEDIVPDETGMPKRESGSANPPESEIGSMRVPRECGSVLEPGVRNFMEQRFNHDFRQVRIHTSPAAVRSARQLRAHAYTVGQNIYFNEGQYDPGSDRGRRLLAHELTHVIQQSGQLNPSIQRQPARRRRGATGRRSSRGRRSARRNLCARGSCPQGRQRRVVRGDCSRGGPLNRGNYISALHVSLSSQTVQVVWSRGTGRHTETWPCSPNPSATPRRPPASPDTVGLKCSVNHTNRSRDGMAWFTGFASEHLRIGFHNSQPVGPGYVSHGCVRVCCDKAEIINKNTWSGRTQITVT